MQDKTDVLAQWIEIYSMLQIAQVAPTKQFGGHVRGGGYSVQKTLQGCAADMGSKISLLIYEWPLTKCKIWYIGRFSKFSQI